MMHLDTKTTLLAAIRAEVESDPTQRGYAGKSPGQITALLNAPIVVAAPVKHRNVLISDVRGYLEARLVLVRLEDWVADPATPKGDARDAARTLLRVTSAPGLSEFRTGDDAGRANILGLFALLAQTGAGGLTMEHYAEIAAMTLAPAGPPTVQAPRWSALIEGIGGAPNAADEALIAEALA